MWWKISPFLSGWTGRRSTRNIWSVCFIFWGLLTGRNICPGSSPAASSRGCPIARALIHAPALLLCDEPTGNLDQKNSQEIMELLKYSNREWKQTTLIVTHDENIALQTDRIIRLEDGPYCF